MRRHADKDFGVRAGQLLDFPVKFRAGAGKFGFLNHVLMTVIHQRRLGLCLAIFGLILGALAGFWLGRGMLLRTAKAASPITLNN